ncbi:MAG: hypothetical protein IPL46_09585 [Saprospiraceae bacterium]|nr:hypothetical protein [Saprospiraceae bacterium]
MMQYSLEDIERYVLRQMGEVEAHDFQVAMDQDDDLKKEVEKMHLLGDAMELEIEDQLRSQLNILREKSARPQRSKQFLLWSIAAVILLMLGLFVWFYSQPNPDLGQFAQSHYLSHQDIDFRSEAGSLEVSEGLVLLRQGQATEAIEWFENYLLSYPDSYESRFILADQLRKSDRNLEARDQFRIIADSPSLLWKEKATWNELLLSAQYDMDFVANQKLRNLLADSNHSYHLLAIQLGEKLDIR